MNADRGTAGDLDVLLRGMETALGDLRRTARAARRAQAGASR